MSHLHERKEKICLNCGADLAGRYCHVCGQENTEPKESAWHLIVHFFNDVTHFDGKFFSTLKPLIFKPGFLTQEYVKGRRASYLNPIRMYLFISAVFFLVLSKFIVPGQEPIRLQTGEEVTGKTDTAHKNATISKQIQTAFSNIDTQLYSTGSYIVLRNGDSFTERQLYSYRPPSVHAYDSLQNLLPAGQQDKGIIKYIGRKNAILFEQKQSRDKKEFGRELLSQFLHSLPSLLFILLPIIALILRLLYVRHKEYYYVSHGIFVIHYLCFLFIALLFLYGFMELGTVGSIIANLISIGLFVYLFAAMKRFYKQGWFKTFIKFTLITSTTLVLGTILMVISIFMSIGSGH